MAPPIHTTHTTPTHLVHGQSATPPVHLINGPSPSFSGSDSSLSSSNPLFFGSRPPLPSSHSLYSAHIRVDNTLLNQLTLQSFQGN